jgi:hypothetical protein
LVAAVDDVVQACEAAPGRWEVCTFEGDPALSEKRVLAPRAALVAASAERLLGVAFGSP